MFTVEKVGSSRLDMALSGKLEKEDMEKALDDLEHQSEGIRDGVMLYDIVDFHLPSFAAIGVELSRLPRMMRLIRNFKKAAVLTDADWIKKISELEGMFIPGLKIKGFDRDEREKALAWLEVDE